MKLAGKNSGERIRRYLLALFYLLQFGVMVGGIALAMILTPRLNDESVVGEPILEPSIRLNIGLGRAAAGIAVVSSIAVYFATRRPKNATR